MSESDRLVVDDEKEEEEEEEVVSVFPPLSNESIREAVRLWRHDQAQATEKYNHINKWNTSQVTDMSDFFQYYEEFNDNISEWDVSNVTDMSYMFYGASSFNQDVSEWDVSNVTNMSFIFCGATTFNQNLSRWRVSSTANLENIFCDASILEKIFQPMGIESIVDSTHRDIPPSARQRLFSREFLWCRRMSHVLFLANQGCLCECI